MSGGELRQRLAAVLAADVAGYSRLMSKDERATVTELDVARNVFRSQVLDHQGRVIDTAGDSILVMFETATGAVSAALAVQKVLGERNDSLPDARRMRFRIGVHLGDILEKADNTIYGQGVNIAARLQELAEPGGIVASESIRSAVTDAVAATFKDMGTQRVKNVAQPVRAYCVLRGEASLVDGMRPATRPSSTNLPADVDLLVGREADIAELTQWLEKYRLVTVHGPGGIGKTRVAQAVACTLVASHADGAWWIDLAALADAQQIPLAIAMAANLELARGDAPEMLVRSLADRDMLLVMDNCEHLASAVATLARAILAGAPGIQLFATSQELLRVPGEHAYRLDPLAVPAGGTALEAARAYGSVRLLELRAQAADRHFKLSDDTVVAAIELCRRLDGMPLAIEMAAARLPTLGVDTVKHLVQECLLHGVSRDAPARQRTLRAILDWSYGHLTANERTVLRRLSVFAGSFQVETAQQVAACGDLGEQAVFDAVTALADKSLLQVRPLEPPRLRLLESMRQFAGERLLEAGESESTVAEYIHALSRLADEAERTFWITPDTPWLKRYMPDYDELQAAFGIAANKHDAAGVAAIGSALTILDSLRAIQPYSAAYADSARRLLPQSDGRIRARLLRLVALADLGTGTAARASSVHAAVAAWRGLDEAAGLYQALGLLAWERACEGKFDDAESALNEAARLEVPTWPPRLRYVRAGRAAQVSVFRGDFVRTRERARAAFALAEQAGADRAAARELCELTEAALLAGELGDAIAIGETAARAFRVLVQPANLAVAMIQVCNAHLMAGDVDAARRCAVEALPSMWRMHWGIEMIAGLALIAAHDRQFEQSARLLGYADAWHACHSERPHPYWPRLTGPAAAAIDSTLGAIKHKHLRAEGETLSDGQVYRLAQEVLAPLSSGLMRSA